MLNKGLLTLATVAGATMATVVAFVLCALLSFASRGAASVIFWLLLAGIVAAVVLALMKVWRKPRAPVPWYGARPLDV